MHNPGRLLDQEPDRTACLELRARHRVQPGRGVRRPAASKARWGGDSRSDLDRPPRRLSVSASTLTPAFLRSTRARLTLVYAVQFLVVVSAAAIGFWVASSQFEFGAVDASLRAQGNAVRATIEQSPLSGTPVLPTRSSTGLPIESFLVSSDGALIAQSTSSLTFDSISSLVPNGFPAHCRTRNGLSSRGFDEGPAASGGSARRSSGRHDPHSTH